MLTSLYGLHESYNSTDRFLTTPRPTSSRLSSRLPVSRTLNQSGLRFSPRYVASKSVWRTFILIWGLQALEGKDVKDLLLNVGSGGGAAAAPGGAAASGDAPAAAEAKKEEPEEGTFAQHEFQKHDEY